MKLLKNKFQMLIFLFRDLIHFTDKVSDVVNRVKCAEADAHGAVDILLREPERRQGTAWALSRRAGAACRDADAQKVELVKQNLAFYALNRYRKDAVDVAFGLVQLNFFGIL